MSSAFFFLDELLWAHTGKATKSSWDGSAIWAYHHFRVLSQVLKMEWCLHDIHSLKLLDYILSCYFPGFLHNIHSHLRWFGLIKNTTYHRSLHPGTCDLVLVQWCNTLLQRGEATKHVVVAVFSVRFVKCHGFGYGKNILICWLQVTSIYGVLNAVMLCHVDISRNSLFASFFFALDEFLLAV